MPGPRRAAALLSIAAMAVVVVGATAPARAAAPKICVGVLVDAAAAGGGVDTDCATVAKGVTGIDVLEAAGHHLGFRGDGLLCTIDGIPAGGCAAVDDSHYWAYFHRAAGSSHWTYSTAGPASYQPGANTTEGWVYDAGHSRRPPDIAQAVICRTAATARPSRPTRSPSPTNGSHAAPTSTPAAPAAPPTSRSPRGHGAGAPSRRPSRHAAASARQQGQARQSRLRQPFSPTPAASSGAGSSGHGGVIGLLVGLAVVAGLGGAAVIRTRRSRS